MKKTTKTKRQKKHYCEVWESDDVQPIADKPTFVCEEDDDGSLSIDCRKKISFKVNFCPSCGHKAKKPSIE